MDYPCNHCDSTDEKYKDNLLKCKKPCKLGRDWKRCNEALLDILRGKDVQKVMKSK